MMQRTPKTLIGALAGATQYTLLAWLTYGVVEFVLVEASHRALQIEPWQRPLLELVFGVYVLAGMVLGAIGGGLLYRTRKTDPGEIRAAATFSLVLGFVANLLAGPPVTRREYLGLGAAIVLGGVFAGALVFPAWRRRTAFLTNPWVLSVLLLGGPWLNYEALADRSEIARNAASLLFVGTIALAAAFWHYLRRGRTFSAVWQTLTLAIVMGVVILGAQVSGKTFATRLEQTQAMSGSAKPNIVLITMDTVRADHLSVYGYERDTTPRLRDFARGATVYRNAMAVAGMTLPTHASIFTGLYPGWHGASLGGPEYPVGRPLAPRYATLAELLQSRGYQTAAVVANWAYLNPSLGLSQGFETYLVPRPLQVADSERSFYLRESARRLLSLVMSTNEFDVRAVRAAGINRRALGWLNQGRHGGPFFLFLNYMGAHAPYTPRPPFDSLFPGKDQHFSAWDDYQKLFLSVIRGKHSVTPDEKRHLVSQYDGAISYLDSAIGELLDQFRAWGLYDNTLIMITADHGETFGEHNLLEHANGFLYQGLVHVPLLIKYPGQHQGNVSDALASEVDLMPTVLASAKIAPPAWLQGQSVQSPRTDDNPVFAEDRAFSYMSEFPRFRGVRRAVMVGSLKLVTWNFGPPELYDLAVDPEEKRNIYQKNEPRGAELLVRLAAWTASIPREVKTGGKLDKGAIDRIRSLGYVQ